MTRMEWTPVQSWRVMAKLVPLLLVLFHQDPLNLNPAGSVVRAFAVERRRYVLLPWSLRENDNCNGTDDQKIILGWATEERQSQDRWTVTLSCQNEQALLDEHTETDASSITVELPWDHCRSDENNANDNDSANQYPRHDDLANSLWPSAIAGAILCMRFSDSFLGVTKNKKNLRILELGSGLGLMGFAAGQAAAKFSADVEISVELTDHDAQAIHQLEQVISKIQQSTATIPGNLTFQARFLEWRDDHKSNNTRSDDKACSLIVASDVAYYYHLLRPLMDTIRAYLPDDDDDNNNNNKNATITPALAMLVGQANRQAYWDLYQNLQNGCYNQLTDQHEPPWKGQTRMLLYRLQMSEWWTEDCTATATNNSRKVLSIAESPRMVATIPIALLLHERNLSRSDNGILQSCDHVASAQDQKEIFMSF